MTAVGVAEHYAQFVQLCRARIEELGITFETVDNLCRFSDRYTAKLLCEGKTMSIEGFFTLCAALALIPTFEHSAEALAELQHRRDWIRVRRKGSRYRARRRGGAVRFVNHIDFYRQIGRKGAIARNSQARKLREWGRKGAAARWAK